MRINEYLNKVLLYMNNILNGKFRFSKLNFEMFNIIYSLLLMFLSVLLWIVFGNSATVTYCLELYKRDPIRISSIIGSSLHYYFKDIKILNYSYFNLTFLIAIFLFIVVAFYVIAYKKKNIIKDKTSSLSDKIIVFILITIPFIIYIQNIKNKVRGFVDIANGANKNYHLLGNLDVIVVCLIIAIINYIVIINSDIIKKEIIKKYSITFSVFLKIFGVICTLSFTYAFSKINQPLRISSIHITPRLIENKYKILSVDFDEQVSYDGFTVFGNYSEGNNVHRKYVGLNSDLSIEIRSGSIKSVFIVASNPYCFSNNYGLFNFPNRESHLKVKL